LLCAGWGSSLRAQISNSACAISWIVFFLFFFWFRKFILFETNSDFSGTAIADIVAGIARFAGIAARGSPSVAAAAGSPSVAAVEDSPSVAAVGDSPSVAAVGGSPFAAVEGSPSTVVVGDSPFVAVEGSPFVAAGGIPFVTEGIPLAATVECFGSHTGGRP